MRLGIDQVIDHQHAGEGDRHMRFGNTNDGADGRPEPRQIDGNLVADHGRPVGLQQRAAGGNIDQAALGFDALHHEMGRQIDGVTR